MSVVLGVLFSCVASGYSVNALLHQIRVFLVFAIASIIVLCVFSSELSIIIHALGDMLKVTLGEFKK